MTQTLIKPMGETMGETLGDVRGTSGHGVGYGGMSRLEMQRTHRAPTVAIVGRACVGMGVMLLVGCGGLWAVLQLTGGMGAGGLLAVLLAVAAAHLPLVLLMRTAPRETHYHHHDHRHLHIHGADAGQLDQVHAARLEVVR